MTENPIDRIEWRHADTLIANDYNPNVVFNQELKLLERSLLLTGWVQPILITPTGRIIDGFHRWSLSQESAALLARDGGRVPCAVLDIPDDQAMILTIRMNRAKGTHVALRMSSIVKDLLDNYGYDPQHLAAELGATVDEITLLHQEGVFTAKGIEKYRYSKAWIPVEERGSRDGSKP